jgi:hypothetical protein
MPLFEVELIDNELTRGWQDLEQDDGELARYTNRSTLQVEADNEKAAKAFALEHNPDLEVGKAKEVE